MADKNYQNLVKMEKHPGYYQNPVSEKIYWRSTFKGRPLKKSTGKTKISEAKQVISEFLLTLNEDNLDRAKREKAGALNPSLSVLWAEMIESRELDKAENTKYVYGKEWRLRFEPFMASDNVSDVNKNWVLRFEKWFLKTFPDQSYFQTGKYLQMFLNYLHDEGYVRKKLRTRDLNKMIVAVKKKKKVFRVYTKDEMKRILASCGTQRERTAISLYQDTGGRKMEILSAKWEDVDLVAGTIKLWSSKNAKRKKTGWRTIPLTTRCLEALKLWSAECPKSDFIFPSARDHNRPIAPQVFDKAWVEIKTQAGIKGRARVHDFRHTVATMTARLKWRIDVALAYLDMSYKIYIETYVHGDENDMIEAVRITFELEAQ